MYTWVLNLDALAVSVTYVFYISGVGLSSVRAGVHAS